MESDLNMSGEILQYQWCASRTRIRWRHVAGARYAGPKFPQIEIKSKAPFGNRNGRMDKSDGLDPQFAKLKKDLSLALREISNLKNQLHQAK